jgi:catechol 2,3-dioxygenase-like lactoylglutathione lyase family enzyme
MLGVTNLAVSLAFYRDQLGLELAFESPGFAFFRGGGVTLCLSEPLAKAAAPLAGATEVVFGVSDVEQAYQALTSRNVSFTNPPRQVTPDSWAANFTDPDGHRLAVFGPRVG